MSSFLTDIGDCIHLAFVVGLDWASALSQIKMTSFLFHVPLSIQPL